MPEPVGYPPSLQRDIALEVQQRRQKPRHGGIVHNNALQIRARRVDQIGRSRKRLTGDAREQRAVVSAFAEPFSDLMGNRAAKVGMIEDRGRQRGAKQRIGGDNAFGLTTNREPKLINGCNWVVDHVLSTPGSSSGPKHKACGKQRQCK